MINLAMICRKKLRNVFNNYNNNLKMYNVHVWETIIIVVNIIKLRKYNMLKLILKKL